MSAKITYRLANQEDVKQIQRLQTQLNEARETLFSKQTQKFHARKRASSLIDLKDLEKDLFIVAINGEDIVGYVWGQLAERPSSVLSRLGYIEEVCVDTSARGQGIAKELLERLAGLAKEKGCDHMTTHTDAENMAAQALYESFGMTPATVEFWKEL